MKLLRKNLLLTVVFSGYFFFSIPSTTQGFIARAGIYNILVKKVHEPQWRIGYNFLFGCAAAFKPKELEAAMTKSLRVWLQPLRELYPDKVFTDDFLFVRLPDMKACNDNREARRQVDIRITFTCKVAASYARVGGGVDAPDVCMRKGTAINRVFLFSLAHEIGHAFGMGDTYARGRLVSTGGLDRTEGKQPSSIMAGMPGLQRPRPFPYLKEDDKNGIIWLYKYYHENQPAGDCFFPDYVPVEAHLKTLRACEPRAPLIFEVKHGAVQNVLTILRDDPNLDLNARDSGGNTALHYAVRRGQVEVVEALLKQASIKVNITNKKGRTPAQLARRIKRRDMAQLIEAHPTAKLPPWSVEAREKLATIWGQLKQRD